MQNNNFTILKEFGKLSDYKPRPHYFVATPLNFGDFMDGKKVKAINGKEFVTKSEAIKYGKTLGVWCNVYTLNGEFVCGVE